MIDYSTVKSFILHPERCVREFVAEFFAESNIGDADVAQLLLDAYERGVEQGEGWGILRNVSVLPQTEATLQRLQRIDASDYNTIAHIDNAIVESDLELLRKFPDIRPKLPQNISILDNRFRLAAMKTAKLWEELWRHSESGMVDNLEKFDYGYGGLIVKELSARQDFPVDKYLERIQMVYPEDYRGWDEAYLCALSGELRSEESLPFLIRTVKIDGDFVPERASEALAKIGTASVVEAIGREYLNEEIPFRIHATGALGNIKTEASENLMLELLPKEKDITQKTSLGFGLCKLFSTKGIPMALTLLRYGYDTMMVNLEEAVYINHVVNGLEHPDMKKWRESIERDEERMRGARNALSIGNISMDQMKNGFENLFKRMNETKKLNELYSKGFKVGRNDPCPCGSGKKYKKCCGK